MLNIWEAFLEAYSFQLQAEFVAPLPLKMLHMCPAGPD